MKDALGNEIILGKIYGYSNRSDGIISIIVGEALEIEPSNKLKLRIISKRKAVYGLESKLVNLDKGNRKSIVSVYPNTLFSLNITPVGNINNFRVTNKTKGYIVDNNDILSIEVLKDKSLYPEIDIDKYNIDSDDELSIELIYGSLN